MPRKAKQKRLTEWLEHEQQRLDGSTEPNGYVMDVPEWAYNRLLREGSCTTDHYRQVRLPGGKAIRSTASPRQHTYAITHPGDGRIDLTRFLPKSTAGTQGSGGEVRRPSVDSRSPQYSSVIVDSLSSTGQVGRVITPERVTNIPSDQPTTFTTWLTTAEAERRFPRRRRR